MTAKQAREGIVERLAPPLKAAGFDFAKARGAFYGSAKDFRPSFSFAEIDTGRGVELRPQVGLRAEAVENIVNRAARTEPRIARNSATLGNEIGRLTGDVDRWRIAVRTEQDFDPGAALALECFEQRAVPFYREYGNLEAIDRHINAEPGQPAILCPADLRRAESGVAVARLLKRSDIGDLIEAHRRHLRFLYEGEVPDFEDFLKRLDDPA